MSIEQFDPKEVAVVAAGMPLTGFADGTFVTCGRVEDIYTESVGAQGNVTRNRNRDPRGEIRVTLKGESPSNLVLQELALSSGTFPVQVLRIGSTYARQTFLAGGTEAWLQTNPGRDFGEEETNREYIFRIADYNQTGM